MAISIPNPIVVAPVAEKVADRLWVLTMNVNANDLTKPVSLYISVAPYVPATNEVLRDQMAHIQIDDLLTTCATNPTLAQALGAIYIAVENLCKERRHFGMEPDHVAPTIGTNPLDVTAVEGEPVSLSVSANGSPLNYQWRKGGVPIDGAVGQSFAIQSVTENDEGEYDVIVSNNAGSVTSTTVMLTVNQPE